jgi:hypothetical protein
MKKWNTPEVIDVNISETADGLIDIGWEGPFNIVFADRSQKTENPTRPDPENPTNPATPTDPEISEDPEVKLS